jgi:hypothetical protein
MSYLRASKEEHRKHVAVYQHLWAINRLLIAYEENYKERNYHKINTRPI